MNSYSTCRVTTSGCRIERIADEGGARHVLVLALTHITGTVVGKTGASYTALPQLSVVYE